MYYAKPDETYFVAMSFDPFTKQTFSMKVCNNLIICVQSEYTSAVTLPAGMLNKKKHYLFSRFIQLHF